MPVTIKEQTESEKSQEQTDLKSKMDKVGDDLVGSLDLSEYEQPDKKQEDLSQEGAEVPGKKLPKEAREEEAEGAEEEGEEGTEQEGEEEVIPKSKFEKRLRAAKRREQILEARIQELEGNKGAQTDSRRQKLEALDQKQLKALKRDAMLEYRTADDDERAKQLLDLADEIDEIIQTGPQRFQTQQVEAYNKAAQDVMDDPENEGIDFENEQVVKDIKSIAVGIMERHKELKNMVTGQATALKLAVDHYRETNKTGKVKSRETDLKRQVTTLKRKTALDTNAVKGKVRASGLKQKLDLARDSGSFDKKVDAITDLLDVDKYLPSEFREEGGN